MFLSRKNENLTKDNNKNKAPLHFMYIITYLCVHKKCPIIHATNNTLIMLEILREF